VPIDAIPKKEYQRTIEQKFIENKAGLNVSSTSKIPGNSRASFYGYKQLYEADGQKILEQIGRKKPNIKKRIDPELETKVVNPVFEQSAWGKLSKIPLIYLICFGSRMTCFTD